jgi:hypothetical protein
MIGARGCRADRGPDCRESRLPRQNRPLRSPASDGLNTARRASALPHFYFHLVTACGILRSNGVVIGKRDYASWVGDFVRPRG